MSKSETARPTSYLIASDFRHAETTAETDWGWKRTGATTAETPGGERVRIVANVDQLRGIQRGTKLYLGYRWFDRSEREKATIHMLIDSVQMVIGEPEVRNNGRR